MSSRVADVAQLPEQSTRQPTRHGANGDQRVGRLVTKLVPQDTGHLGSHGPASFPT